MANSRETLRPTNSSRGRGLSMELPYKPGFVDNTDLEEIKMTIDKELALIAYSFYQTTERLSNIVTRLDKLESATYGQNIVAVLPLGSDGSFDFGVRDFPRKISVQCSVASGYFSDEPTSIEVYMDKKKIGSVESQAHENLSGQTISLTNYGVVSVDVEAGKPCEISVKSNLGSGGSTSAWVVVNKTN